MIAWALVWMFGSTTRFQDWISLSMWSIDALGVLLAVLADTFLYTPAGQDGSVIQLIQTLVWWAVPILAVFNGVMGIVYHLTHPHVERRRKERRLQQEIAQLRMRGEYDLRRQELEAQLARDMVQKRRQHLAAYRTLVSTHRELNALEQQLVRQLLGENNVEGVDLSDAIRATLLLDATGNNEEDGRPKWKGQKKPQKTTKPGPKSGPSSMAISDNHRQPHYTQNPPTGENWA